MSVWQAGSERGIGFDRLPPPHEKRFMTSRKIRGFSLLEMMIVIAIGAVMVIVASMTLIPMMSENHVDQAYDITLSVLRTYRNLAIAQSNRYIIVFTPPQTITVQLWGYSPPPAASPAPVTVSTILLPQDMQFAVWAGFPNPGPDGFGTGTSAQSFNACTVVAAGNPCLIFYPDGSAQDDLGNYNSGVIYVTRPTGSILQSRAVDVYGTTGRVRGWRLYTPTGGNVWEQQ
jgi:prepilin-type N-terminal cleavage/methylation domain-containing protein